MFGYLNRACCRRLAGRPKHFSTFDKKSRPTWESALQLMQMLVQQVPRTRVIQFQLGNLIYTEGRVQPRPMPGSVLKVEFHLDEFPRAGDCAHYQ